MVLLDKSKPYDEVFGEPMPYKYIQGGRYFKASGEELVEDIAIGDSVQITSHVQDDNEEKVIAALKTITEDELTSTGKPKVSIVRERSGVEVDIKTINQLWTQLQ